MNGQYQLIQRIMLYIVLLVAMLMRNQSAVLTVIIGVAMTCVTTTAFHAMGLTRSGTFDLDVLGVFQILGVTCYSCPPSFLNFSDGAAPHLSRLWLAMSAVGIPLYVLMFCWVLAVLFRGVNARYVNGVSRAMLASACSRVRFLSTGNGFLPGRHRAQWEWAPIVSVVLAIIWKCLLKGLCYLFGRSSAQGFAEL
ncbi:hypothetical protein B0H14DRAFT_3078739 [Mycena olivaceomarginata]|nr:hypothetical protein B0H14DRAFT_3078739 [Mycena olivaceomarginata]